jgi:hypothetical protein
MQPILHRTASTPLPPPLHHEPEPEVHHAAPVPIQIAVAHPEKVGVPDGIPHDVVGMLAYGIVLLSGATLISYLWAGVWLAVVVALVGGYVMERGLPSRSRRERKVEARGNVVEHEQAHASHVAQIKRRADHD